MDLSIIIHYTDTLKYLFLHIISTFLFLAVILTVELYAHVLIESSLASLLITLHPNHLGSVLCSFSSFYHNTGKYNMSLNMC